MKYWTPQTIAFLFLVAVVGTILLMIEIGILKRSTPADVEASRNLLSENINLVLGLIAGFIAGKNQINK